MNITGKYLDQQTKKSLAVLFSNHVLQISDGIESMGGVRLELLGYLVLAWVLVYLVIWKGLQNSGKVLKYNQNLIYLQVIIIEMIKRV